MALVTISMLLKTHQCVLTAEPLQGEEDPWSRSGSSLPADSLLSHLSGHLPALFPLPLPFYYHTTLPTIPKQQHVCFSFFSGFPTLNATQTSPSALPRPLWKPARWHSQQPCVQPRTSAAHSKWCHCPPEQTVSRAHRKRGRRRRGRWKRNGGGGELRRGEERESKFVRKGWQRNSLCTITLVFRLGQLKRPSGHSFAYIFSLHWLLQWKHIPAMPHCHSLFRFLITNSIT